MCIHVLDQNVYFQKRSFKSMKVFAYTRNTQISVETFLKPKFSSVNTK